MVMPEIKLSNGNIETLKWIGLIAMTCDHVNKYLFNATLPMLYEIGRLAMPIFVFVLGYNMARPYTLQNGVYLRIIRKLFIFGSLSTVPYISLGGLNGGWFPLNILFTLLVSTISIYLIEKGTTKALIISGTIIAIGGGYVEFWWPPIIGCIGVWAYCKKPSITAAVIIIISCASLFFINNNWWALAVIPVITATATIKYNIPRLKWIFYVYYPIHLMILWLIRIPMSRAGYLFF